MSGSKPRLVKQKTHLVDDTGLEHPDNTAIQELSKDIPDFQVLIIFSSIRFLSFQALIF